MAVPKKRTTRSTKGQRRSHDAIVVPQLAKAGGSSHRLAKAVRLGFIKTK